MQNKLMDLIPTFYLNNEEAKAYKKIAEDYNKKIKEIMTTEELTSFKVDNLKASCTISEKVEWDEDHIIRLINDMVEYKEITPTLKKKIVKKKEYVDFNALEDAIYNGKIKASNIEMAQRIKPVVTLRVSKEKEPK